MRIGICVLSILIGAGATAVPAAAAGDWDGFHPTCGAPGDLVYVQGRDLDLGSDVRFQGVPAEVIRARAGTLLCRVPVLGLHPRARITVDGVAHPDRFHVLPAGTPVVHAASARIASSGQMLLLYGRRLRGGDLVLMDDAGEVRARAPVTGGDRAVAVRVPYDLAYGPYVLGVATRPGGVPRDASLPIEIRPRERRELITIEEGALWPGRRITCVGNGLGPLGSCRLHWRADHGTEQSGLGWCNGFDRITTIVPEALPVGLWHDLRVEWLDGRVQTFGRVRLRAPDTPTTWALDVDHATQGGVVGLTNHPPGGLDRLPEVLVRRDGRDRPATLLARHAGGLGHGRAWLVRLPATLETGAHRVLVRLSAGSADAGSLRIDTKPR